MINPRGVWLLTLPEQWPNPPPLMTFSALHEIEVCPHRWGLKNAEHPTVWERRGYPEAPQLRSFFGSVVHLGMEEITRQLVERGCNSIHDKEAVGVMKELGGLTAVVRESVRKVLSRMEGNPRALPAIERITLALEGQVPHMREHLQLILARTRLAGVQREAEAIPMESRSPLGPGSHAEVRLASSELGWAGVADLINLTSDACEIVDFKTGRPQDHHRLQLQTYALLWSLDAQVNPSGREATKLTIWYAQGDVDVPPPSSAEMERLASELKRRAAEARQVVSEKPPPAIPSPDACAVCDVKQLCRTYWTISTQRDLLSEPRADRFGDAQIKLRQRRGVNSWEGTLELASFASPTQDVIWQARQIPFDVKAGTRLRVLRAQYVLPDKPTLPVILAATSISEHFIVPDSL